MNRRAFIASTTAAAIGLGSSAVLPKVTQAQGRESGKTPTQPFWPDKARLVISVSLYPFGSLSRLATAGLHRRLCHQVIELGHERAFVWSGIVTERLGAFHQNLVRVGT